jgi:hypothetical protein
MGLREILIIPSMWTLILAGFYFGYRLLKLGNHLLGYEWMILGFSASCFFLAFIGAPEIFFDITMFCDAFSRFAGIPIIATLGLMRVTNNLRLAAWQETAIFAVSLALTAVIRAVDWWQPELPYFFVSVGMIFTIFLVYFAVLLIRAGEVAHGLAILVVDAALFVMASLEGIVPIPGDETNLILNFYFLSHLTWALCFTEIYIAYRALARRKLGHVDAGVGSGALHV